MNGMAALNHLLRQASGHQTKKELPFQIEESDDYSFYNNDEYFQDDESILD